MAPMSDGELILVAAALLAAGIAASLLASRVRLPGLLLFLGLGMLLGTDGLGWIDFNDYELARTIGVVALALILFEGGLTAGYEEIRPVLRPALSLAILGTLGTCVICGLAASWLLDLSTIEGMELGAIISATDGAAIFALLRESTLRRPIARTLEGESGFNDPVAVLLVIGFIDWLEQPDYGVLDMLLLFVREMGIGAVVGVGVGSAAVWALRRTRLASAGLYPVATLSAAGLAFGGAQTLHGSGFLRGLPGRPGARVGPDPGEEDGGCFPRGARMGGADRDVPRSRPAGLPERARRRVGRGHGAHAGSRVRGAAAVRGGGDRARRLQRRATASCWGGPGCAARCPSCSRRSR